MIKINMFSTADKVAGQGVGSAYKELIYLMNNYLAKDFDTTINSKRSSDITHYHTINFSYYLSTFLKRKRGIKIGYVHFLPETLEGSVKIPQPFKSIFYKYVISFYRRMDQIIVVNPSFIPKLVNHGLDESKITFIPNFVSHQEFYPVSANEKQELRKKYHIPMAKFVVIGDGQIQERKGVADFIRLAERNPEIQFIWAGGFSFGRITDGYEYFKEKVANPPENLLFTGIITREELQGLLNLSDLFLLPSFDELFPMSVLEAFNVNLPVLLRDLDLYPIIIDGFYQRAKDIDEMDKQINKIKTDSTHREALINASKAGAHEYSEENLANIWRDYYKNQIDKAGLLNVENK